MKFMNKKTVKNKEKTKKYIFSEFFICFGFSASFLFFAQEHVYTKVRSRFDKKKKKNTFGYEMRYVCCV